MHRYILLAALIAACAPGAALANPTAGGVRFARPAPRALVNRHALHGIVTAISGNLLSLQLRSGRTVTVDVTQATDAARVTELFLSRRVRVAGDFVSGVFYATAVQRARDNPKTWAGDS